jgi:hypothetical protein
VPTLDELRRTNLFGFAVVLGGFGGLTGLAPGASGVELFCTISASLGALVKIGSRISSASAIFFLR